MFASFKAVARWKEQTWLASFSVISWIVVMVRSYDPPITRNNTKPEN